MIQPFAVRLALRIVILNGIIINECTLFGIYQKHFSRMQTFLFNDLLSRNAIQCAYLRRKNQIAVICDIIPGRAQTVSVQNSAHHIAV